MYHTRAAFHSISIEDWMALVIELMGIAGERGIKHSHLYPLWGNQNGRYWPIWGPDRGVVIGGPEYEKSWTESLIDSEMAGPILMKLSGIDRGNSVTVLGQKN